ncbi:YfhO family protein [Nocardioides sp. CCNWLW239]|uniref:YfhO family protein n=1 Tax=Nocardioides sp. CCNWLW239 TaxID=3128902 RepID=UPI003016E681
MARIAHTDSATPRRHARDVTELVTLGLLVVFLGVALGPALVGRGVFLDVGLLHRYLPFQVLGPVDPSIWCRGDTVDGVLPGIAEIRERLRDGRPISWSPYEVGGTPLASIPNLGLLNPVAWPYLVMPLWLAPAYVKLLQCLVAVAGMVGFLGRIGVSRAAAWLAGLVFISSGFMVMWTNWPQSGVACWIPALFWAVHRTVSRRGPADVGLLSLVVAAMIFGGFPAVTMYALTLAGLMALIMAIRSPAGAGVISRIVPLCLAAGGVLLGGVISAVQLVPFVADLAAINLEGRDFSTRHPPGGYLLTTVAPHVWGSCVDGAVAGPLNPIESTAFLGAGAVVLAIAAVAVRRRQTPTVAFRVLFAVVVAVIVIAIWVGGPVLHLIQSLPLFGSNSIARAASVLGFLVAVLAAIGFDRLRDPADPDPADPDPADPDPADPDPAEHGRPRPPVAVTVGVVIAAVAALVWGLVSAHAIIAGSDDPDPWAELLDRLVVPGIFLVLAIVTVLVAVVARSRARAFASVAVAVLVAVQSIMFVQVEWPLSQRDDFYPVTPTHRYLQQHLGEDRFASTTGVLYPSTADMYGLRTPLGHQFTAPTWRDLLEAVDPTVMRTPTYSDFAVLDLNQVAKDPVLDRLGVRYWVTSPSTVEGAPTPRLQKRGGQVASVSSGERLTCTLPPGRSNGIAIVNRSPQETTPDGPRLHVRIRSPKGDSVTGVRGFADTVPRGELRVALSGGPHEVAPGSTAEVWFTGLTSPLQLRTGDAGLTCSSLRPAIDGLQLVSTEPGALVYERRSALPRIRWAGTSITVEDREDRISRLKTEPSAGTVVLADAGAEAVAGSTADVEVLVDDGATITARVRSTGGAGYLVVADSLHRKGWRATVDGRPATIVDADHAMGAVRLSPGTHTVHLQYTPPGWPAAGIVSAVAVLLALALLGLGALRGRHRRQNG